jgi:hypothetical protein
MITAAGYRVASAVCPNVDLCTIGWQIFGLKQPRVFEILHWNTPGGTVVRVEHVR